MPELKGYLVKINRDNPEMSELINFTEELSRDSDRFEELTIGSAGNTPDENNGELAQKEDSFWFFPEAEARHCKLSKTDYSDTIQIEAIEGIIALGEGIEINPGDKTNIYPDQSFFINGIEVRYTLSEPNDEDIKEWLTC